jgi:hypothetical protein
MIKDRQRVVRLRKRLSLLLMVTIAILLWVKNKYNDIEYLQDEMDYQSIVIEEQCKLIDSLSGIFENNIKKDTIIAKIEPVKFKKHKNEDVKLEPVKITIDSIKKEELVSDTL